MKCQPRILAGTALGLLMASTQLSAAPLHGDSVANPSLHAGVILAQANCAEGKSAEACAEKPAEGGEKPNRKKQQEKRAKPAQREEAAPAGTEGEMAPVMKPEEKPRREKQEQRKAEPAQNEQVAPAGGESEAVKPQEKQPERKQRKSTEEAKPAETRQAPAQSEEPADQVTQPKPKKEELKEFLNKKQGDETTEPQQAEKPKARKSKSADEAKPAGEPAEEAAPKPEAKPAETEKAPATGEKPAEQATQPKSKKEELKEFLNKKKGGEEATEPQQAEKPETGKSESSEEAKPADQAVPEGQKPGSGQKTGKQQPATGEAEGGKRGATQPELPTDTEEQAMPKSDTEAAPLPKNAAPLPDSAKKAGRRGEGKDEDRQTRQPTEQPAEQPAGEAEAVPRSDSAAQSAIDKIGKIESVEAMQGKRIDAEQWRKDRRERRQERRKRDNIDVVKQYGDRIVVKFGDNIYVDNRDVNERLERHARDSYVEELPRGFTRTTIVKDNGARVVTIRNAYGDIVRRSRIMPDDREVVLYYVPEDDYDRIQRGYHDAGADLPPLRLSIPADEYILDAERARPEDYYTYLDAPPVEPVERIYSVNEVVHSARIRDKVRRIDLDTITFDTGSADIGENQISKLEALGEAMNKILQQNPAETFLIEGHTDAVGSDASNLVLSDERADSVAEALTKVFDIPPENLTTQGYGEEYLKVNTDGANRDNRRVAIRRITPLVSPVASAR